MMSSTRNFMPAFPWPVEARGCSIPRASYGSEAGTAKRNELAGSTDPTSMLTTYAAGPSSTLSPGAPRTSPPSRQVFCHASSDGSDPVPHRVARQVLLVASKIAVPVDVHKLCACFLNSRRILPVTSIPHVRSDMTAAGRMRTLALRLIAP